MFFFYFCIGSNARKQLTRENAKRALVLFLCIRFVVRISVFWNVYVDGFTFFVLFGTLSERTTKKGKFVYEIHFWCFAESVTSNGNVYRHAQCPWFVQTKNMLKENLAKHFILMWCFMFSDEYTLLYKMDFWKCVRMGKSYFHYM